MILSSIMHRIEPYLNLHYNDNENLSINKQTLTRSNLFSCSIHNCLCKRSKIGLVLYPKDIQIRNVILLVCDQCYNYKLENDTQHIQLEKWYFNIYKDSKSFQFKSRFLLNEDGSFYFYKPILNTNDLFNIKERELEDWEKEAIQQTVRKKLNNAQVLK
ncbi:unnamed protein product [Rotaria sordida]|uniref:Uncharacterized protein n=1 Tax=Rotaria sordida TaxID=392033 RepID=A0A813YHH4_9BILA|nr:unnamed protein product [Rotaria sordida]CAF0851887.1 unnamed protein product [Rotaria sordida]CAF0852844.1 unnamed protein product [Rotaria sordida]CAF0855173.1 unnamed protein product [Rotaria sordida]CAF0884231.1 unnamed protein product [Rotaria sordida]